MTLYKPKYTDIYAEARIRAATPKKPDEHTYRYALEVLSFYLQQRFQHLRLERNKVHLLKIPVTDIEPRKAVLTAKMKELNILHRRITCDLQRHASLLEAARYEASKVGHLTAIKVAHLRGTLRS